MHKVVVCNFQIFIITAETEMVCNYKCLSASRDCWDCVPTHRQSVMVCERYLVLFDVAMANQKWFFNHFFLLSKLEWALGTGDQDETIAEVGNVVLKRKDFWTLGLNEQLEATVS